VDNDCDGAIPIDEIDGDGDGWMVCDGDCDDANASTWPSAPELCDRNDNDCDGAIPADEADDDGDGWSVCASDCDDGNPAIHPGATESCNGPDNDCDGVAPTLGLDSDGDGIDDCEELVLGADCRISDPSSGDTDWDGIDDPQDPYPRDPHAEFLLLPDLTGGIEYIESNRDGTFQSWVTIGSPIGLDYAWFTVADFDSDGQMDFLAHSVDDGTGYHEVWYFSRDADDPDFAQVHLGDVDTPLHTHVLGSTFSQHTIVADVNEDGLFDIVALHWERPGGTVTTAQFTTYLNNNNIAAAGCVESDDPTDGCAFTRMVGADVTATVAGEYEVVTSYQARDLTGDGLKDLLLLHFAGQSNHEVPVYVLAGNGDGTFGLPTQVLLHNASQSQSPANTALLADFDGDQMIDLIAGMDDDGDAGAAWLYPGTGVGQFSGSFIEAFDVNAAAESGESHFPSVSRTARTLDLDFDGHLDVVLGIWHTNSPSSLGYIHLMLGHGDGTFTETTIGPQVTDGLYDYLAAPRVLCPI